jgi:hypothetical protein
LRRGVAFSPDCEIPDALMALAKARANDTGDARPYFRSAQMDGPTRTRTAHNANGEE